MRSGSSCLRMRRRKNAKGKGWRGLTRIVDVSRKGGLLCPLTLSQVRGGEMRKGWTRRRTDEIAEREASLSLIGMMRMM